MFSHEQRTGFLLDRLDTGLRAAINEWGIAVERVRDLLVKSPAHLGLKDQIIKSILDGPLDADKMDYLIRDSEELRLPYGAGIDYERVVHYLTVAVEERLNHVFGSVALHENGKVAAESVAFARYALYGAAYWHRAHRAAKAMVQRLGYEALRSWKERDATRKEGYEKQLRESLYSFLDQAALEQHLPGLLGEHVTTTDTVFVDRGVAEMC